MNTRVNGTGLKATNPLKVENPLDKAQGRSDGRKNDASVRAKRSCQKMAEGTTPQLIHRFDNPSLKADKGFLGTGLGAKPDRTHQLTQQRDVNSHYVVRVQSLGRGRVDSDKLTFHSDRPVTPKDFNNVNSDLGKLYQRRLKEINEASDRMPDVPVIGLPKSDKPQPTGLGWMGQQVRNTVGGIAGAETYMLGEAASFPERSVKFAASLGNIGKAVAHAATGGQVFKTVNNPIELDKGGQWMRAPENTAKWANDASRIVDQALGAEMDSLSYRASAVAVPLLVMRRGRTPAVGTAGRGPASTGQRTSPKQSSSGKTSTGTTTAPKTASQPWQGARAVGKPDGKVEFQKPDGRGVSMEDLGEAVAHGKIALGDLPRGGYSERQIMAIMKRAAGVKLQKGL
jgi:hypothetical protein